MTRPSTSTDSSLHDTAPDPSQLGSGPSSFYVEEPDIPAGMTCAVWRRQRRPVPNRGLLAHVRAGLDARRAGRVSAADAA